MSVRSSIQVDAIGIIPARSGSKGIKDKNIRKLGKKPLLAWTIQTAMQTDELDGVYVTTDGSEIAKIAKDYGADVIRRPSNLATDKSPIVRTVRHVISHLRNKNISMDSIVLLEPTCPFRSQKDIQACLELLNQGYDSCATFTPSETPPSRLWILEDHEPKLLLEGSNPWLPRQSLDKAYKLNGACYAFNREMFMKQSKFNILFGDMGSVKMPAQRSVDIDTPIDLELARAMVRQNYIDE